MEPSGFLRRLLALIYDSLLVLGLIILLSLILIVVSGENASVNPFILLLQRLIIICSGPSFYIYFWLKNNGQTLGMQTWKIKVVSKSGSDINLKEALKRCLFSIILFPGYFWIFINKEKKSWADIVSETKIIKIQ